MTKNAKKEGSLIAKKEIVLEMYKNNISMDMIIKCTGLVKEEIDDIINNN